MGLVLLVVLFSIVIAFSAGRLQAYVVTTESMQPTINPGDHLLVYVKSPTVPQRGQVVALRNPHNPADGLCKRVVAIPKDVVEIRNGRFILNGVHQKYNGEKQSTMLYSVFRKPLKLQSNEYFVLGDNREASLDSSDESFGTVHTSDFIGKVIVVYWPLGRFAVMRKSPAHPASSSSDLAQAEVGR